MEHRTKRLRAALLLAVYMIAFVLPMAHAHDHAGAAHLSHEHECCEPPRAFVARCADGCANPEHHHGEAPQAQCEHTCPLCKLGFDWAVRLPLVEWCLFASAPPPDSFLVHGHIPDQIRNARFARAPPPGCFPPRS